MNLDSFFLFDIFKYNNRAENNTFESEIPLSNKIIKTEEQLNRLEKSIFSNGQKNMRR